MRRKLTRRNFLKIGGTGLVGATLLGTAACGGGQENGDQGGGGNGGGNGGGEEVTLRWWDYFGDLQATDQAINDAINRYQEENPQVTIERTPIGFADLRNRIIQAAATGDMPDIVIVDNPDHQSLADQGALADITDLVQEWPDRDQYFEGPWESTMYQDRNYGVPFESNATGLFYNEDVFQEAGISAPPANWDELRSIARELTSGDRFGFAFSAASGEEGTFTFLPFLWQAGGDVPDIGGAAGVEALAFWNALVNEDGSVSQAATGWGQADVFNQFIAGNCAMMINGPWQIAPLEEENPDFSWNVAPWPQNQDTASILGGENFAIGEGSNVEAAWEVISWMAQPDNIKPILETIGLPNREDMRDEDPWASDPQQSVFLDMVEIARPRAYGPEYPQISEQISTMYTSVLTGESSPQEAATQASEAIQPLLP